ncbi:hypothetical protein BC629DRAFT_1563992 [Irpex lacteus]|nr:hypothetical protein BC629DRAFT_1563992 [Irpex lacteus]
MASESMPDFKELSQRAMSANKDHQYALKVYTERLQSELETVDKLLAAADQPEEDLDDDIGGSIAIPHAAKAVGPVPHGIIFEESPFAEDAIRRQRYLKSTVIHPMKAIEVEALADAVRSENHRLFALEAQRRGQQPFVAVDEHPPGFFHIDKVGLNWERIASKVSDAGVNYVRRTAQECEIRWLGDRHPEHNHTEWTKEESARAVKLVGSAKEGEVDWVEIAAKLGTNRTPVDCMRHAVQRKAHVWTPEADNRLLEAVRIYGRENWQQVARQVSEDATSSQCQSRYVRSLDPNIKRGEWTKEEDDLLKDAVSVFGRSWMDVCVWIPGRNNEQCRERWQELDKHKESRQWTEEDDEALLQAREAVGGSKWVEIGRILGRNNNVCRHRYTNIMKRRAKAAASPAPAGSDQPTAQGKSAEGASKQSKNPPKRRASKKQAESTEDTPEVVENETSAPAKPKPKPKLKPRARPRGKRAAPGPEQHGDSEMNVEGNETASEQQTPPQLAEGHASGSAVVAADSAADHEASAPGTTEPTIPLPKPGRKRRRKNPAPGPSGKSSDKEPVTKKRRLLVSSSAQDDTASPAFAEAAVPEATATKPTPRKRGKARKSSLPQPTLEQTTDPEPTTVDGSGIGGEGQGRELNGNSAPCDGSASNPIVEQSSSLRRSTRVRKATKN